MLKSCCFYLNLSYLYTWERLEGDSLPERYGYGDMLSSRQALGCV